MKKPEKVTPLRWLYAVLGKDRTAVLQLMLIRTVSGLQGTFFAVVLKHVMDAGVEKNLHRFFIQLVALLAVALLGVVLSFLGSYYEEKSKAQLEHRFRMRVFAQLLNRSYAKVSAVHSGDWMTRICSDAIYVSESAVQVFPRLLGLAVQAISALVALAFMLPSMLYILVPGGIALTLYSVLFRKKLTGLHRTVQHYNGAARSFMQERLSGMAVLRAYSKQEYAVEQAEKRTDTWAQSRVYRGKWMAAYNGGMQFGIQMGYLLGILLCGVYLLQGNISYGTIIAVLQLSKQAGSMTSLSGLAPQYYTMIASIERMMEIENFGQDCEAPPKSIEMVRDFYRNHLRAFGLRSAFFTYPDGTENVLSDFNMEIQKGQYVAFMGTSGYGKTTVIKLLLGLFQLQDGKIYLKDDCGNEQALDASWRGLFAYVPQGNFLFSGTIREAVTFGQAADTSRDEALWRALSIACADDFIRKLPQGLDTELGERGAGLSEGQMQRIAIARAIYAEYPILIFDEATSALDQGTERRLLQNLRSMTDHTVILVTHRTAALEICDATVAF